MSKPQPCKIALAWLAVVAWAGMVWGLGTDPLSHSATSRYLEPLATWLFPDLTPVEKRQLLHFVRKFAHVFEYAVLAGLLLRAATLSWRRSALLAGLFALGAVSAMAVADEWRQAQSSARTGSMGDVALDIGGGLLAIAIGLALERRYRTSQPPQVG